MDKQKVITGPGGRLCSDGTKCTISPTTNGVQARGTAPCHSHASLHRGSGFYFLLQRLELIEYTNKLFPERRHPILDARRNLGIRDPLDNAELNIPPQTIVQHFRRKTFNTANHFAGPVYPAGQKLIHRQRPLAPIDGFNHSGVTRRRRFPRNFFHSTFNKMHQKVRTLPICAYFLLDRSDPSMGTSFTHRRYSL